MYLGQWRIIPLSKGFMNLFFVYYKTCEGFR